eukprot:scaffold93822_cov18-Prasinocladus_malaysianus.AAC.1
MSHIFPSYAYHWQLDRQHWHPGASAQSRPNSTDKQAGLDEPIWGLHLPVAGHPFLADPRCGVPRCGPVAGEALVQPLAAGRGQQVALPGRDGKRAPVREGRVHPRALRPLPRKQRRIDRHGSDQLGSAATQP